MIVQTSALRTWQGALPATCEQHYLVRGVFYWDDGFDFNPEFGDMDEDFTFEPGARWVSESRLLYFLGAMGNAEYDLKGQLLPMLMEHSYKSVSGTLQRARKNLIGSKALQRASGVANCSLDGSHHCAKKADVCALLRAAVNAADDAADVYLNAPTDGRSRPAGEQQQMQENLADAEATYLLAACAAGVHGGVRGMLAAGAPVSHSPSGRARSTTRKRKRPAGPSASQ